MSLRKRDSLVKLINISFVDLPCPRSLSYMWNYGSLLVFFLFSQIITGLLLAAQFTGDVSISFDSVIHIVRDVRGGWALRVLHANGASMFFLFMYIHIGRGLYYGSYRYVRTWISGVTILLVSIITAFLGYVLPWGQMSFWAATVITNLLSAVPYVGVLIVEWVWGGFAVGNSTLIRFFSFHFLFPFIILFLVILHFLFLHETGSGNPIGVIGDVDKIVFHPYYLIKDIVGVVIRLMLLIMVRLWFPYIFMDVDNFIMSNPLVTPVHIQPEWYFLFAYTVLRSVPRKIGGVVALIMRVLILYTLPFFINVCLRGANIYNVLKWIFWIFVGVWGVLTWIGACEVEYPYKDIGGIFRVVYFFMYFGFWMFCEMQDLINE